MSLRGQNLSIQFGGLRAVDDFNLNLEKDELVAIIGRTVPERQFLTC